MHEYIMQIVLVKRQKQIIKKMEKEEQTQLLLRLPANLKHDLQRCASMQGRKLTQEVVIRLKASLEHTNKPGIAPSQSPSYQQPPMATVLHTNDPAHDIGQSLASHHITAIDAVMLKVFKAMPPEKQLALLSLLK